MNQAVNYLKKVNFLVPALCLCLCEVARAQIPASLSDLGAAAPRLGANDIAQVSTSGYDATPDGLNYYINNSPACGQTFTTGNAPTGYELNAVSIRTAGDGGGEIDSAPQQYYLWIYSIAGSNATVIASYISEKKLVLVENDWLQWRGLALPLLPNRHYAFAMRNTITSSWESVENASSDPYPGGELVLVPTGGGTITFGSSHAYDATFVLGLSVSNSQPNAVWETLVDGSSFGTAGAFRNKWAYNYPWGTDHNGSARMDQTNVVVAGGVVTLTSSPTKADEGVSSSSPHLPVRYNSGTIYLKQQITISPQFPIWDIAGQFKAPTHKGTWPAFWMTGVNSWPPESDFMEFKGSSGCNQNTYDGKWQGRITAVSGAEASWHSYRMVATLEDSKNVDFRYFIDGIMETEQVATTFVSSPCWLIIDYQMEGSSGAPGPGTSTCFLMKNIVVKRENMFEAAHGTVTNGVDEMFVQSIGH